MSVFQPSFEQSFKECGLVAILRGLQPKNAREVGLALYEEGFRIIEVPLNSPEPLESIRVLADSLPDDALVGAGTVLTVENVAKVESAGGKIIMMPHSDEAVITEAKRRNLFCTPGVATPTEGFRAFDLGADAIKLFPAEMITPAVLKSWRAVFDHQLNLLPVGSIDSSNMGRYVAAGASGFGLGGSLYKSFMSVDEIRSNARDLISTWKDVNGQLINSWGRYV